MRTIKANTLYRSELEIKRSRFISSLYRVSCEDEAREFISQVKAKYSDARHNCSAFIYQGKNQITYTRSSDDGEPAGTAGRPMLETLQGSGLNNLACVVTRYFGGIKLGTGGLVRAYAKSVNQVLQTAQIYQLTRQDTFWVEVDLNQAGRIVSLLTNHGYQVLNQEWGATLRAQVIGAEIPKPVSTTEKTTGQKASIKERGRVATKRQGGKPKDEGKAAPPEWPRIGQLLLSKGQGSVSSSACTAEESARIDTGNTAIGNLSVLGLELQSQLAKWLGHSVQITPGKPQDIEVLLIQD